MVILIITAVFVGFLLWILIAPVTFHIDTYEDDYSVSMPGVFRIAYIHGGKGKIKGSFFFIPFQSEVPSITGKKEKKEKTGKRQDAEKIIKKKKKAGWLPELSQINIYSRAARQLIRSFQVKKFYLQLDTGDVILNAYLYPLALLYKTERFNVNINFDDELGLILTVRNRTGTLLWIGTWFMLKKAFMK